MIGKVLPMAATFACVVLVSSCGGGGGDTPATRPPSAAQGLWTGSTASSRTLTGLVFGDGTYYVFYSPANVPSGVAGVVCVFRPNVTAEFGIVTAGFGNVTDDFGDVTEGCFAPN